jgi:DNA segregation ATPase FtsK/SpoIIIE, S-DNA-T family
MIEGEEFIYILINRSLPGLVKIGRTDRSVAERVRELSAHTGVPTEFTVFREFLVRDSVSVKRAVHVRLREHRLSENREFFSLEPETAAEVIEEIVGRGVARAYDPEAEDELLARATEIAGQSGKVWPSLLAASLGIPHAEAERLMVLLQGRGMIDHSGMPTFSSAHPRGGFSIPPPSEPAEAETNTPTPANDGDYHFPPLALLQDPDWTPDIDEEEHRRNAESLLRIFAEHDIDVSLGEIHVGPVFTRYEFAPGLAVRLERLPAVETSVLKQLDAKGARILSSVPGKHAIGVEFPNRAPLLVPIRAILETEDWGSFKGELPVALGKDVGGRPVICDLARAPHILIAGMRGAGRSTTIHAVLASILYAKSPASVRLLMIDPTARELVMFNMLPHMLIPVVTDPGKVPAAMEWLLAEVEARFRIFAETGFGGLLEFNGRVRDPKAEGKILNHDLEIPDMLPHVVVVVNEIADSVLVAGSEIEVFMGRLAQHGAAAGIHLIAVTQRPSVDVLTETIRGALHFRIALRLGSQLDSRTVLGVKGAETLVGRGDMLFNSVRSPGVVRLQGALVSVEEMAKTCQFLRRNGPPQWASSIQQFIDSRTAGDANDEIQEEDSADGFDEDQELFYQAIEVLKSTRRATATMLQRRLRIGHHRASRILDVLWQKGIIGPDNGDHPREILVDLDTY